MSKISIQHIRVYEETHPALYAYLRDATARGIPYSRALADAAERGVAGQQETAALDVDTIARHVADEFQRRGLVVAAQEQTGGDESGDETEEEAASINRIVDLF